MREKDEPDKPRRPTLRLVKTPEAKRPSQAPELREVPDDTRRRGRVRRERGWCDPGGKDAARSSVTGCDRVCHS